MRNGSLVIIAACVALLGGTAGCGGAPSAPSDPGPAADATRVPPPTIVARVPRTATPTAIDPLAVVPAEGIEGIVVPAGAELIEITAATDDADARADYRIADVDAEALSAWFAEHWPAAGWGEPEDRDGALVFVHTKALSARHASVGQKRSATVVFDLDEGIDFTLLVEAPK